MRRAPEALIPFVLLIACVCGGYLWHQSDIGAPFLPAITEQPAPTVQIGGPFTLTDQNGVRRTDQDFHGKYMLVFFGYTYCPDVCPTTLAVISGALDRLGVDANRVTPVFISVDPKRDTAAALKIYLSAFSPRIVGLTGSEPETAAAAKAYRVYYQVNPEENGAYTIDHSSVIYLMDAKGAFVTNYTLETGPDEMAKDLKRRLAETR